MGVDLVRSCYSRRMRYVIGDVSQTFVAHWYFCAPGVEPLPFPTVFGSANWDEKRKEFHALGDDAQAKATWRNGSSLNSSDGTTWAGLPEFFMGVEPGTPNLEYGPDGTPLVCKGLVPLGTPDYIAKFRTPNTVENSAMKENPHDITSTKTLVLPSRSGSFPGLIIDMGPVLGVPVGGGLEVNLAGILFVGGVAQYSSLNPPPGSVGPGTTDTVAMFTSSTTIGDSPLTVTPGVSINATLDVDMQTLDILNCSRIEGVPAFGQAIGWEFDSTNQFVISREQPSGNYKGVMSSDFVMVPPGSTTAEVKIASLFITGRVDVTIAWTNGFNAVGTIDTGLSRTAAGQVAIGNGTQGDSSGTLLLADPTTAQEAATKNYVDNALSPLATAAKGDTGSHASTDAYTVHFDVTHPTGFSSGCWGWDISGGGGHGIDSELYYENIWGQSSTNTNTTNTEPIRTCDTIGGFPTAPQEGDSNWTGGASIRGPITRVRFRSKNRVAGQSSTERVVWNFTG